MLTSGVFDMLMEILHPQGDPFAEPQLLLINMMLRKGIIKELVDRLEQDTNQNDLTVEKSRTLKTYLYRLFLLLVPVMKFGAEAVVTELPLGPLTKQLDSVFRKLDGDLKDKYLTIEYLKYLRRVVSTEDLSLPFLEAGQFLVILANTKDRTNMISSLTAVILEDLRKLTGFKLLLKWVEANETQLELIAKTCPRLTSLMSHYNRIRTRRKNLGVLNSDYLEEIAKKSSKQKESSQLSPVASGIATDPLDDKPILRKRSSGEISSGGNSSHAADFSPVAASENGGIEVLVNKYRSRKGSEDDGSEGESNSFTSHTSKKLDVFFLQSNVTEGLTAKIDIQISGMDEEDDDEDIKDGSKPLKKLHD